jgi:putative hydrolase of the HAD superfamily
MKAVLFDLDDTLLDRKVSLTSFVSHQAKKIVADEDVVRFVNRFIELDANGSVWKDVVYSSLVDEFYLSEITSEELLNDYVKNFRSFCRAKPGSQEAIKVLHSFGLKLGLISNGKSPFQEQCFEALSMGHLFHDVIVSDAVGYKKPDKNIFLLACKNLAITPNEAIFVGDNPIADIQGANAVGMYTIYVPNHFGPSCNYSDAVCDRFSDLPGLVKNAL